MQGNGKKRTLRVNEASKALDCSDSLVYELCQRGELTAFRIGLGSRRGGMRILTDSLEAFIARRCREFEAECMGLEIVSTVSTVPIENLTPKKKHERMRP